jgi:hypothetical protein
MSLEQIKECKYISSVGLLKTMDELGVITYNKELLELKINDMI